MHLAISWREVVKNHNLRKRKDVCVQILGVIATVTTDRSLFGLFRH